MTLLDIVFIGIGLAIDASCVSACNGLTYKLNMRDTIKTAFIFAVFQCIMPLLGYFGIGMFSFKLLDYNQVIALVLLSGLGIKMIYESVQEEKEEEQVSLNKIEDKGKVLTTSILLVQGVTTSIDALSVGITFHGYDIRFVTYGVLLIGVITWIMCSISVRIGREIGTRLNKSAGITGGFVLIFLGIKIFIAG